jgi:carbon-monoxide dehydrogenase medium subunit
MNNFTYLRPATLEEALELLERHGGDAAAVAGGTDVFVKAKRRKAAPKVLVSLRRLEDLRYIRADEERVFVGGLATLRDIEQSGIVADRLPALADATRNMASVQIRNVATMAGNIANAAPSADTAPPLLVSGAEVRLVSKRGERTVPMVDFYTGSGKTVLERGELIREFVIPMGRPPYSQAYWKHSRRKAMDLAMVSVAVHLELEDDMETCRLVRIAHGVAAPTPIRTPEAEAQLVGKKIDAETLKDLGETSCGETLCRDSIRGQAWYRQEIIKVMVRRMALLALERARAKTGRR